MAPQPARTKHNSKDSTSAASLGRRWRWPLFLALFIGAVLIPSTAVGVGVHMENNDTFCASCHTEPETTYVSREEIVRSGAAAPQDLAMYHAGADHPVACIQCHSGEGLAGRAQALALGGQDLLAYVRGSYPQPAPLNHPILDANCLKCHREVLVERSFNNHYHRFLPRWQQIAGENAATCVDCHAGHVEDGSPQLAFLNKERARTQCNACHRLLGD